MFEAEFWVAIAFILFVATLGYVGAHKRLVSGIDARRDRIKAELEVAARLKAEAQSLLAQYQRKLQEAEREAQAIVESAKGEAERLAAEAEAKMEEFVSRHSKMAETRIAQAEAQALADVRSAAAEAAAAAAETILSRSPCERNCRNQREAELDSGRAASCYGCFCAGFFVLFAGLFSFRSPTSSKPT
jgi:F-type H+-transporting ATPase subunit b